MFFCCSLLFCFFFYIPSASFCPVLLRCLCSRHSRTEHLVISTQIPPPEKLWVKVSASSSCLPTRNLNCASWESHLITSDTVILKACFKEAKHILAGFVPQIFIGKTKVSYLGFRKETKPEAALLVDLKEKQNYFQDKVKDMHSLCRLRTLLNKKKI